MFSRIRRRLDSVGAAGTNHAQEWEVSELEAAAGICVAALGCVTLFLGWRSREWPLIHDAPLFHYLAWRIAEGDVLYRDLFDINVPGVHLLHLAVLKLVGAGDAAWRFFDLAWLGITSVLLALYCRRLGPWSAVVAPLLFSAYHLSGGAALAGQRDYLLVLFLLAGAYFVARFREEGQARLLVLAGLAAGIGTTIKPHAALFWFFLAFIAAPAGLLRARRWQLFTIVIGSGILAPAAVAVWLWHTGGLLPFVEILTRYLIPIYSRVGTASPWGNWQSYTFEILIALALLAAIAVWQAVIRRSFDVRRVLLIAGIVYGIIHYAVQAKGWEYQLYPVVGFGCVLASSSLDGPVAGRRRLISELTLSLLLLLAWWLGLKGLEYQVQPWLREKQHRVRLLVSDLDGRVRPGGTVQIFDTMEGGSHALLLLRLRQPTRFLYDFHFLYYVERPYIQKLRAEFLDGLRRHPPEFVVVFERGWPAGGFERLAAFPELSSWIEAGYELEKARDSYRIFVRRSQTDN